MSWKSKLKTASFKGAKFSVTSSDSEFGRRFQHFEYPNRDKGYIEDLGQKDSNFTLEAFVVGKDYMSLRDKLISVCSSKGPGELIHPYLGTKTVTCSFLRTRENSDEGGVARISLSFIEAGEKEQPSSSINTQKSVYGAGNESILVSSADFIDNFKINGLPSFISENAVAQIDAAETLISNVISVKTGSPISLLTNYASEDYTTASDFCSKITSLFSNFTANSSSNGSSTTSSSETSSTNDTSSTTAENEYKAAKALLNYSATSTIVVSSVTTTGSTLNTNTQAINDLIVRNATVVAAKISTEIEFTSYDEAVAIRDEIIEQINNIMEKTTSDDVYTAFAKLKTTVNQDITSRGANLAKIENFSLNKSLPSLIVSYNRYGSIDYAEDIASRNNVANPLFVPGGEILEALSS
ncbi:MAG: DNA circularization protein [Alphaproteobacteria bacterium]